MNEAKDLRDIKEFATGNKIRDLILKEMNPTVTKFVEECDQIRQQMRTFQQQYSNVLRFQTEKASLENSFKQLTQHCFEINNELVALKAEVQLSQSKNVTEQSDLRGEIEGVQRNLARRDETLELYDRKIAGVMEGMTKHQLLIGDRMSVFDERFKKLSKQTLEMTKTVKQDFNNSQMQNQILRSELLAKMSHNEDKERVLNLYMSEREETARKILDIEQTLKGLVPEKDFQEFKKVQVGFIEDRFADIKQFLDEVLPQDTINSLKVIGVKFAEVEQLKLRNKKMEEELKREVQSMHDTIKTIEIKEEEQLDQIRNEQGEAEEKIIGEIGKRFQTIEENIEQRGTQTEQDIEEKLRDLQEELEALMNERLSQQMQEIEALKEARKMVNQEGEQRMISDELATAKAERLKVESYGQSIKQIAEGLNEKLAFFSNRLTICRSDIELFTIDTKKELKKISQIKLELENHMDHTGKLMAFLLEASMILTSFHLTAQQPAHNNVFSTYHDGIILELDPNVQSQQVVYRRTLIHSQHLQEGLLYSLMNLVDDNISSNNFLRWDRHPPSQFFRTVKEGIETKTKTMKKNLALPFPSGKGRRRSSSRVQEEEQVFLEYKRDGDETNQDTNGGQQKSRVTIGNGTVWALQRPNSEMHKRYKMKKSDELVFKRENSDRQCFTASKSHRKTKPVCF